MHLAIPASISALWARSSSHGRTLGALCAHSMRILASASAPRAHSECAPDSMDALWAHSGSHGCAWGALQPGRTPGALRLACGHCERIPARTIAFGAHSGRAARMVILWAHCGSDERTRSAVPLSLLPSQASPFCILKKMCFVKENK